MNKPRRRFEPHDDSLTSKATPERREHTQEEWHEDPPFPLHGHHGVSGQARRRGQVS